MNYVIFDLDNCIADDRHRLPLIDWSKEDLTERYAAYHEACHGDQPFHKEAFMLALSTNSTNAFPVFFTGRPEAVREKTAQWLEQRFGMHGMRLLMMRNDGDNRRAVDVKRDMLINFTAANHINPGDILCAYDDRQDIIDMYSAHGIPATLLKIHDVCAMSPPNSEINAEARTDSDFVSAFPTQRHSMKEHTHNSNTALKTGALISPEKTAADILFDMAETYRERNKIYGDNFKMVGAVMEILHGPNSIAPASTLVGTTEQFNIWHLYELLIVKLTRFANSGLTHKDSIRDLAVYAAMVETLLEQKENQQ
jgi:hypothetical protein